MKSRAVTILLLAMFAGITMIMVGMGGSDKIHGTELPPVPAKPMLLMVGYIILAISILLVPFVIRACRLVAKERKRKARRQRRMWQTLGFKSRV